MPPHPDMGASFREFDLSTFKFPGGRDVPNADERAAFKQQNLIVRGNLADNISSPAIKNLVNGWYGIGPNFVDPHPDFTGQYSNWFPPGVTTGWEDSPGASADTRTSHQYLYRTVVAKSCRTCHVALPDSSPGSTIDWTTFQQFVGDSLVRPYVFGSTRDSAPMPAMPHAFVTYKNFWSSRNPSESQILTNFSGL